MGFIKGMVSPPIFLSLLYQFHDIVKEGKQVEAGFIANPGPTKGGNYGSGRNLTPGTPALENRWEGSQGPVGFDRNRITGNPARVVSGESGARAFPA
jgi:hypothetical protein